MKSFLPISTSKWASPFSRRGCGESQLPAPLAAGEDEGQKPIFYRGQTHPPPRQHRGVTCLCEQSCWNPRASSSLSQSLQPSRHSLHTMCYPLPTAQWGPHRPNIHSQGEIKRHQNRGNILSAESWKVDETQRNSTAAPAGSGCRERDFGEDKDSTEQPEDGGMHPQLPELVTGAEFSPCFAPE